MPYEARPHRPRIATIEGRATIVTKPIIDPQDLLNFLDAAEDFSDYEKERTREVITTAWSLIEILLLYGGGIASFGLVVAKGIKDLPLSQDQIESLIGFGLVYGSAKRVERILELAQGTFRLPIQTRLTLLACDLASSLGWVAKPGSGSGIDFYLKLPNQEKHIPLELPLVHPLKRFAAIEYAKRDIKPVVGPGSMIGVKLYDMARDQGLGELSK